MNSIFKKVVAFFVVFSFFFCSGILEKCRAQEQCRQNLSLDEWYTKTAKDIKEGKPLVISQYVAFCDNKYQGIVPVSKNLGNGNNTETNLYWGAGFGYRNFFKKDERWKLVHSEKAGKIIAQLLVFSRMVQPSGAWEKNGIKKPFNAYLIILGYKGKYIRKTVEDYLGALMGRSDFSLGLSNDKVIHGGSQSHLVAYAGHNYLMDLNDTGMRMIEKARKTSGKTAKAAMILACKSSQYFTPGICGKNVAVLVLTKDFMAPEAYTASAAYDAILYGQGQNSVLEGAVRAYARYQKISIRTAKRMFTNLSEKLD